jgi:hypothetical protein
LIHINASRLDEYAGAVLGAAEFDLRQYGRKFFPLACNGTRAKGVDVETIRKSTLARLIIPEVVPEMPILG